MEVSDYGVPTSLNSTGTVLIQVEDVNDNFPRFKEKNIRYLRYFHIFNSTHLSTQSSLRLTYILNAWRTPKKLNITLKDILKADTKLDSNEMRAAVAYSQFWEANFVMSPI